jgi:glycosyltransferase involved in cell wall biosynthesis
VVEIGKTGYLFDDGDVNGLVDGVRKIVSDKEVMRQMGRDARAYAETQTWDAMMDEMIVHYQRLIDNHRIKKGGKRVAPRLP